MDELEMLVAEAIELCVRKRCCRCEFAGKNNPRSNIKKCQAMLFAKHLREHGIDVARGEKYEENETAQ